ncbi:hypothetical protein CEUSTIGMA_g623.t1 [Chlamydomonas eustigma]|uniref:Uncharacterized protein n=1 Tax=Chlamydomonas eustigma TaxID=1157962 RepID=A0A250WRJ6_9CHLO|nr:hypothetical protein CEUSTIGMA_g623.t1 [Chlamydomonas eustigma]|eukprot:GAX73170.1 hypothetical protein CEUSTIGMA_g623.t1 [Chlamydomonas eustigma]
MIQNKATPSRTQDRFVTNFNVNKRNLLATFVGLVTLQENPKLAQAQQVGKLDLKNQEVKDSESPFIQELLRRTAEKKEERKKERLDDYYRRNFKDYFEWEAGSALAGRARGISEGTSSKILKWLDENK